MYPEWKTAVEEKDGVKPKKHHKLNLEGANMTEDPSLPPETIILEQIRSNRLFADHAEPADVISPSTHTNLQR